MTSKLRRNKIADVYANSIQEVGNAISHPITKAASSKVTVILPEDGLNKVAMRDAGFILSKSISHGVFKEASDGSVWRVANIDGEEFLVRDDDLSDEALAVQTLMGV